MDTILDQPWTVERFLAWEDQQEDKHEFDGQQVIPMTGGSLAHQQLVFNLRLLMDGLLQGQPYLVSHEIRLRIGSRIRYPDVLVFSGRFEQRLRILTDAIAIFEVLSDDTETTDRVTKLIDYAAVPSVRSYVLLEQTAVAATLFQRAPSEPWTESGHVDGALTLPGLNISLPLAEIYQGLTFLPTEPRPTN